MKLSRGLLMLISVFCSSFFSAKEIYGSMASFINFGKNVVIVQNLLPEPTDSLFLYYYGIYNDSLLVYSRLLHNGINTKEEGRIQQEKAHFLKQQRRFSEAAVCYSEIDHYGLPDSQKYHLYYETALCFYLTADFDNAYSQCIKMSMEIDDSVLCRRAYPLQALIMNERGDWDEGYRLLDAYNRGFNVVKGCDRQRYIDSIYAKKERPQLRSPRKAMILNAFLPGAGYIYAGNLKEGIINSGFQLVFVGLTGAGIYYRNYFSAAFSSFSMVRRFYNGGIRRVEYLTEKRNYTAKKKYNEFLRVAILSL